MMTRANKWLHVVRAGLLMVWRPHIFNSTWIFPLCPLRCVFTLGVELSELRELCSAVRNLKQDM